MIKTNEGAIHFSKDYNVDCSYGLTVPGWVAKVYVEKHLPNWKNFAVVIDGKPVCGAVR